jgi:hypothetical protein
MHADRLRMFEDKLTEFFQRHLERDTVAARHMVLENTQPPVNLDSLPQIADYGSTGNRNG